MRLQFVVVIAMVVVLITVSASKLWLKKSLRSAQQFQLQAIQRTAKLATNKSSRFLFLRLLFSSCLFQATANETYRLCHCAQVFETVKCGIIYKNISFVGFGTKLHSFSAHRDYSFIHIIRPFCILFIVRCSTEGEKKKEKKTRAVLSFLQRLQTPHTPMPSSTKQKKQKRNGFRHQPLIFTRWRKKRYHRNVFCLLFLQQNLACGIKMNKFGQWNWWPHTHRPIQTLINAKLSHLATMYCCATISRRVIRNKWKRLTPLPSFSPESIRNRETIDKKDEKKHSRNTITRNAIKFLFAK